jgi:glycosyltransferase involved in cell wall biosynthesis
MAEHVTVSMIITAYRRSGVVGAAIASALAQTYPVFEVVVVDDASGDDTAAAVLAERDRRVRLVQLRNNLGPAGAMNAGIAAARGDLVALLDSDDLWLADKLERQVAAWQAHPLRAHLLVASRVIEEVDGVQIRVRPDRVMRPREDVGDYLFVHDGLIQTSTMLLPRALAQAVGFDAATRRHSDPGFVLRLQAAGANILHLPDALTRWRAVGGVARVSGADALRPSLDWLDLYGSMLGPRARVAFRYRNHIRILRRDRPVAAAWLTLRALFAGVIGRREIARLIRRIGAHA